MSALKTMNDRLPTTGPTQPEKDVYNRNGERFCYVEKIMKTSAMLEEQSLARRERWTTELNEIKRWLDDGSRMEAGDFDDGRYETHYAQVPSKGNTKLSHSYKFTKQR